MSSRCQGVLSIIWVTSSVKLYFSKRKCGCPRFHLLLTHPRDENKREEVSQFNFGFRFCFAFIVSADFGSLSNFSAIPMVKLIVFYRKSIIFTKSRDNFLFELNISTTIPQHFIAEVFPVSVALIFKTFKLDTLVICMGAMICSSVLSASKQSLSLCISFNPGIGKVQLSAKIFFFSVYEP